MAVAARQIARVLDGFWLITHITGVPGRLVRLAIPNNSLHISYNNNPQDYYDYYYGNLCPARLIYTKWGTFSSPAIDFSNWLVKGDTSRDQHIGVLMGLASVIKYVQNTTLLTQAGAIIIEIAETLQKNGWKTIEPTKGDNSDTFTNGADMNPGPFLSIQLPLAFLKVAAQADPGKFDPLYRDAIVKFNWLMTLNNDNGRNNVFPAFYPANLDWECLWSWWIFEDDPLIRRNILPSLEREYNTIKNMKNAFFQSLYLSLNPEENQNSAAANDTKKVRIIAEILDTLARKTEDLWIGGPNYYPAPDLTEIGIDITNTSELAQLYDHSVDNIFNGIPSSIVDLLFGVINEDKEQLKNRILWALPVNWRPQEDWCWQRSPYILRSGAYDSRTSERYHADTTTIYWWARFMGWITPPEAELQIIPQAVSNAAIFKYFGGTENGLPSNYNNYNSILEMYSQ